MPFKTIAAAASIAIAALAFAPAAQADNDDAIIAGAAGFAVGTLFGSAVAGPHYAAPRGHYVPQGYYAPRHYPHAYYAPRHVPRRAYVAPVSYRPAPWTPAWYAYCEDKYRSFDPRSGTFMGYDGQRHMCR